MYDNILLSVKECEKLLHVERKYVYKLINENKIIATKDIANKWLITRDSLEEFIIHCL